MCIRDRSNYNYNSRGSIPLNSGKWYWEIFMAQPAGCFGVCESGKMPQLDPLGNYPVYFITDDSENNTASVRAANNATGASITNKSPSGRFGNNKIAMIAYDADTGKLYYGVDGTWQLSADPANGSNPLISSISTRYGGAIVPFIGTTSSSATSKVVNFGQDSSFAGNKVAQGNQDGNSIGDFYYTPPTGFLALCTKNLPAVAVVPSENFNTVLYTGNATSRSITGVGFQPDFVWNKTRSASQNHFLYDVVRGASKDLRSNQTNTEGTSDAVTAFGADGFSVGSGNDGNENNQTYVNWNWKAGGSGTAVSESGSGNNCVNACTHSANADAGFSIVKYAGRNSDLSNGQHSKVTHGMGSNSPQLIIIKNRDATDDWMVIGEGLNTSSDWDHRHLNLNSTAAKSGSDYTGSTVPNSTHFFISNADSVNTEGENYIAYCFASVEGYSAVGSYTGNGVADGPFVSTSFAPAFVLTKVINAVDDWSIADYARSPHNVAGESLRPNSASTEDSAADIDILSNGFKVRQADSHRINYSGDTFIYIAFASVPFKFGNAR